MRERAPLPYDPDLVIPRVDSSTNRKISPLIHYRLAPDPRSGAITRYDNDVLHAAFGIASGPMQEPEHGSCAGATDFCANDCYSIRAENGMRATGEKMRRNFELLKAASEEEMKATIIKILHEYNERSKRYGVPVENRIFRWHWAGDVFSQPYACAIASGFEAIPDVKGTIYTRTYQPELNVVPNLIGVPNLNVYLSTDPDNYERSAEVYSSTPDELRFAFLGDDYAGGRWVAEQVAKLGVPGLDVEKLALADIDEDMHMPHSFPGLLFCPEEFPYGRKRADGSRWELPLSTPYHDQHKRELVRAQETGEEYDPYSVRLRGACSACMACYGGSYRHVIFAKNKVLNNRNGATTHAGQVALAGTEVPVNVTKKPAEPKKVTAEVPQESLF